jgi:hypothetical protein
MTSAAAGSAPLVRRFHAIVLWPLQLVPAEGAPSTPPWQVMQRMPGPWRMVQGAANAASLADAQRYSEFVSFLPYVQRCLYGEPQGSGVAEGDGESPIRVFERDDIATARLTFDRGGQPVDFAVEKVQLYFFTDVEIIMLAVEISALDLPLPMVQDTLFRFGRAFPAFWNTDGRGGHCLERLQWISAEGAVLASSDFEQRERYLRFVAEHRAACIASHWEFLLEPLVSHDTGRPGPLRYRQIEYYRMPWMAYLALDNPATLSRATFARLALGAAPGDPDVLPFSARSLEDFEARYCFDRYWAPAERPGDTNTRYICSGHAFAMVGSAGDHFFMDPQGGLLGQFRQQYARLGLLSHFHRASLLMLSDRLVVAIGRLNIRDTESVKRFKRHIRRTLETFLRFTHRYWFHEVSTQDQARSLFRMWATHLGTEQLFAEVREEVQDMNDYLDSDSLRRQANTVVRLTVVTTLGLVGTVATGVLGMNLFAYPSEPWSVKLAIFLLVLVPSVGLILYTVVRSKVLAEFLEALSDDRMSWRARFATLRSSPRPRRQVPASPD